jgi:predicted nuclease of restriction endonuclease-like (RecB) superfamily
MDNGIIEYGSFVKDIKELIYRRQYEAMKRVNSELMQLYWEIGEEINRQQIEKGWGKSIVDVLSKELQKEFPGVQGFSARNLWLMRSFYIEYSHSAILHPSGTEVQNSNLQPSAADLAECPQNANLPPLVAEISWTKNVVIMQKCKDPLEREFYIKMTKRYGWTKDVLINNIENQAFACYLSNQTNFDATVPEKYRLQAKLAVKDEYNYDFLEMGIEHSETELEAGLIRNIEAFLIEMGGHYTFLGRQFHLDAADDDSYIDLLLFHRQLRSLIAIELKIGDFKPEYAGKMQFYLTALDEKEKLPDENPSIGIIICKSKNRTKVEYTLRSANAPIGVATYSYSSTLPKDMERLLPSPEEIAKIVDGLDGGEGDE